MAHGLLNNIEWIQYPCDDAMVSVDPSTLTQAQLYSGVSYQIVGETTLDLPVLCNFNFAEYGDYDGHVVGFGEHVCYRSADFFNDAEQMNTLLHELIAEHGIDKKDLGYTVPLGWDCYDCAELEVINLATREGVKCTWDSVSHSFTYAVEDAGTP